VGCLQEELVQIQLEPLPPPPPQHLVESCKRKEHFSHQYVLSCYHHILDRYPSHGVNHLFLGGVCGMLVLWSEEEAAPSSPQ
jgi:hypothetical protein